MLKNIKINLRIKIFLLFLVTVAAVAARQAHNLEVVGSNPIPAIIIKMKIFCKNFKKRVYSKSIL